MPAAAARYKINGNAPKDAAFKSREKFEPRFYGVLLEFTNPKIFKIMACEKCLKYEGDSTTFMSELAETFEVIESSGFMSVESGTAKCRFCAQEIEFFLDETLIPKMRIKLYND